MSRRRAKKPRPKLTHARAEVLRLSRTGETSVRYDAVFKLDSGDQFAAKFQVSDYHDPLQSGDRIFLKYSYVSRPPGPQGIAVPRDDAAAHIPQIWFLRNLQNRQILVDLIGYQSRMISRWVWLGLAAFFLASLAAIQWFITTHVPIK